MKMKTLLFYLFISSVLFCSNSRKTEEFFLNIPDGWIQIPRQTVEFLKEELNRPANNSVYENYSYLYQQKSNDTLFTIPHILIQVSNNGRPDKADFENAAYMQLDRNTGYLWSKKDSTINVIIPTEKGTINIYCVSSLQDSKQYFPVFNDVIKSITVNHKLLYRDDFVHNTPVIRDIVKKENQSNVFLFTVIFAILAVRIYRRNITKN